MTNNKIYFIFADLSCEISGPKEVLLYIHKCYSKSPFASYLKTHFSGQPSARLKIILLSTNDKDEDSFYLSSHPFRSEFSLKCSRNTFFIFPVIEQVLRKIFYILFFINEGAILHSSCIEYLGKAFLFVGPSGSGKSTITKILSQDPRVQIIADNNVYLKKSGNNYVVYKSPFLEWNVVYKQEISHSDNIDIGGVFVLKKSNKNYLQDISFSESVEAIARQVQIPIRSISAAQQRISRTFVFNFVSDIVANQKLKKIYFQKNDPKLIRLINKV